MTSICTVITLLTVKLKRWLAHPTKLQPSSSGTQLLTALIHQQWGMLYSRIICRKAVAHSWSSWRVPQLTEVSHSQEERKPYSQTQICNLCSLGTWEKWLHIASRRGVSRQTWKKRSRSIAAIFCFTRFTNRPKYFIKVSILMWVCLLCP